MRKLLIALFCGFMLAGTAIASDFDPEKCTYPDLARKANKLSHEFEKVRWRAEDGNWCESAPGGGIYKTLMYTMPNATTADTKPWMRDIFKGKIKEVEFWDGSKWAPYPINQLPPGGEPGEVRGGQKTWIAQKVLEAPEGNPVVLTPTKLYDLIEELDKSVALIKEREDLRGDKTLKALLNANQRIKECERKIEDLRADLQKTRDQTAHIVKMLRKATK